MGLITNPGNDHTILMVRTDAEGLKTMPIPSTHHKIRNRSKFPEKVKLSVMILMTFFFFVVELVYGHISGSMALIADSFHMLSDVLALIVALSCIIISTRQNETGPSNSRVELLGALVNGVFLLALCFMIFLESIERLIVPHALHEPRNVLIVGFIGFVINLIGMCMFHGHSHGHSHGAGGAHGHSHHEVKACNGHDHEDVEKKPESATQMNIKGVYLHIMTDFIGSIIVILTAAVSLYLPQYRFLRYYMDPFLSLILVFLIINSTFPLVKQTICILLQADAQDVDKSAAEKKITSIPEFDTFESYVESLGNIKQILNDHGIDNVTVQPTFHSANDVQKTINVQ
ncbi:unnamed protein product [Bursaphelenchus xylophilus]|uniref:(pine wood nematode) hypothetical protein n=1 Tax=Bursaphelenchus xylophilus TaxID=6326 RepID=A0A811KQR2_BURXY|nr:unnamed protein product [Bursaphelenchus xylophilus]CAG9100571.1 unnamed protein product [Bursaphelenchus xylophilus]